MMVEFSYDPEAAGKADDVANRIDTSAAYVGQFKLVHAFASSKGTAGLHFEFGSPGGGTASFDCYTHKEDGTPVFGNNQVQAMMAILGLKGLKSDVGKYEAWDKDEGKRLETEGDTFPDLCGKDIGLVLQKEKYTKGNGSEGFRMNLYGVFHPVTKFTASELKEKKAKPEKLEKMLRALKDKDSRTPTTAEPSQPQVGGVAPVEGSY
jgi:hypothetical protein